MYNVTFVKIKVSYILYQILLDVLTANIAISSLCTELTYYVVIDNKGVMPLCNLTPFRV